MAIVIANLRKVSAVIDKVLLTLGVTGLIGIIITISAGIIARSFFTAFAWPEELAVFLFICVAFFGATCCAYRRREIVVDFLVAKIPPKVARPLNIAIKAFILFFMVMVIIGFFMLFPRIRGVSIALSIPRNLYYVPIMVAAVSMFIINIADLLELVFLGKTSNKPEEIPGTEAEEGAK